MKTVWFNQGYASVRDALAMIGEAGGTRVRRLASHLDAYAPVFAEADLGFLEPDMLRKDDAGRQEFLDYCLAVCARHDVDLFVPQGGRKFLADHRAAFAAIGTRLSVPADTAMLSLIDDKARFYAAACDAGLPMPWTREIHDVAEFDEATADLAALGLRACVKPPRGVFGSGFWQLDDGWSLFSTLMDTEAHVISPAALHSAIAAHAEPLRLLVLEYLPGNEISLDCVAQDGRLVIGVARRKLGRAQRLETDGPAFDIARAAIAAFGLSGLINVQCKAGSDPDDWRLLEINTRMSGGCLFTRYAGINLPWAHVGLELGLIDEPDLPVPVGGALVGASAEARLIDGAAAAQTAGPVSYAETCDA